MGKVGRETELYSRGSGTEGDVGGLVGVAFGFSWAKGIGVTGLKGPPRGNYIFDPIQTRHGTSRHKV